MARQTYGNQIANSTVMLAGIKSHKDKLEARGINDQYIEKFAALNKNCVDTNSDQEKAKAALKNLTETLIDLLKDLEKEMQFCKRVVMTEIPKSLWKEFGIHFRTRRDKPAEDKQDPQENQG
jgi:uncharacterized protein with von Willebrand factor type A (vWA) domain